MEIHEAPLTDLRAYGRIPIAFEVHSVLECTPVEMGVWAG